MLKVGLTGGIACGKSRVRQRLAAAGIPTLDLDRLAHGVMAPGGSAYKDVVAAFGPRVLDAGGAVDRKALGALVFADEAARRRLDAIVHPRVREEEARQVEEASRRSPVVVSDAALLIEAGVHLRFDRVVVVHCEPGAQRRRLMLRDGLDEAAAQARIDAQMPVEEKRRFGHLALDTSGRLEETDEAGDRLAEELQSLAATPFERATVPVDRALGGLVAAGERGPRGLTPARVLQAIADTGGLELEAVASRLDPPPAAPWYRAGRPGASADAADLTLPVALWALSRRVDTPFLLGGLFSLGYLVDREDTALAAFILSGLAVAEVAREGRLPSDLEPALQAWSEASRPWTPASPPPAVLEAIRAAHDHPHDLAAARTASDSRVGDSHLVGILVGMMAGRTPHEAPIAVVEALKRLLPRLP